MRKIKITALLLAVLMIVTAFAGCASKSTVTNLDNKVNDLDASISEQKAALSGIESTLATISKALENQGSSDNLDEVIKDVEENEKNVADLTDAIKDLQSAIEDLKKEPETQTPAATPDDLKIVINQYSAKLEALEGDVEDDKINYTPETLAAIREIIGDAEAAIANAADKAAAEAAYQAVIDKLADKTYMSVNGKLYAYILELKGNITDESSDKVDDAVEALDTALKFYEDTYADVADYAQIIKTNITEYKVSKDETINLEAAINELHNDQYFKLPELKANAEKIEKKIAAIDATYTFADVTAVLSDYRAWEKDAKALSPVNLKYVKNYDYLLAAHVSALNSDVAKTIFANGKVDSLLFGENYGEPVEVFNDYIALLNDTEGKTRGVKQVLFVFGTEKTLTSGATEEVNALTSKIYDTIDAWVADWAKEYSLTDLAIEAIIDSFYGENFYARYNADKALVKAFEAESKVLADGIFKNIKALNNKRLGADAMDVLNAYKKNAADINAWRDALKAAYAAELKTVENVSAVRNISTNALYEKALVANFNAMVEEAELTETFYGIGFEDNDVYDNAYYHQLYDFKYEEMVTFLRVTFKEAQAIADLLNKRIENFKAPQAHSIADLSVNIGGYVELDGDKLVALHDVDIRGAEGRIPDTIAEFIYDYKTNVKYDLSGLLDLATYEAKIAEIEKNVAAADAALAALDEAYGDYLTTDGLVTMSDYAQIKALYGLYNEWMNVGHVDMAIANVTGTTPSGVKEYKLVSLFDRYHNINNDNKSKVLKHSGIVRTTPDKDTGIIVMLNYRATQLKKEADLAVSAYEVMDKVYNFQKTNSFSFDNNAVHTVAGAVYAGTRDHFASSGVVSVTCSAPMTEGGFDTKGRTYMQGQSLWTVEYVILDSNAKFTTAKLENYYFSNYDDVTAAKNKFADAYRFATAVEIAADPAVKKAGSWDMAHLRANYNVEKDLADLMYTVDVSTLAKYVDQLFVQIPEFIRANDITLIAGKMANKCVPNFMLPIFAMNLDSRFMVNNYKETYQPLVDARKNFDPVNGGYGFNYIKGVSYAYVDNFDVLYRELNTANVDDTSKENKEAIALANDIEALRIAVKACLVDRDYINKDLVVLPDNSVINPDDDDSRINVNNGIYTHRIVFGEAFKNSADVAKDWMSMPFDLEEKSAVDYLADFDLTDKDFYIEGLVIYKECDHILWQLANCTCQSKVCDECSKTVWGLACVKGHQAPDVYDQCVGTTCELCGKCEIAPTHSYDMDYVRVETLWINHGNGVEEDFDHKDLKYIYDCELCGYRNERIIQKNSYIYECADDKCEHNGACSSIDTGAIVKFTPDFDGATEFIATYHKDRDSWSHVYEIVVAHVDVVEEDGKLVGFKLVYEAVCADCGAYLDEQLVADEFEYTDLDDSMTLTTHDRVEFVDVKELHDYKVIAYYHDSDDTWQHNYDKWNIIVEDVVFTYDPAFAAAELTFTYDCAECVEDYLGTVVLKAGEFVFIDDGALDKEGNKYLSIGDSVVFNTGLYDEAGVEIVKTATYHGVDAGWKHVYNTNTIFEDNFAITNDGVDMANIALTVKCDVCGEVDDHYAPNLSMFNDGNGSGVQDNLDTIDFAVEIERVVYNVNVVYHAAADEWVHDLDDTSVTLVEWNVAQAGVANPGAGEDVLPLEMLSLTYAFVCNDATCKYGDKVTIELAECEFDENGNLVKGYKFEDVNANGLLDKNDKVTFIVTFLGVDYELTRTYALDAEWN